MPDLVAPPKPVPKPVDVASLPEIKLRTGTYENFTRLVFDWPKDVSYHGLSRRRKNDGALRRAHAHRCLGDRPLCARPGSRTPPGSIDGNSTVVEFETDTDSGYHDFKDGSHVVLDILAPKTDATAYAPPGIAKPSVTKMGTSERQRRRRGASAAQPAEAPARAGRRPSVQTGQAPSRTSQASPSQSRDAKPAEAKPSQTASPQTPSRSRARHHRAAAGARRIIPVADGKRTRDGAVITFKGAGGRASAVFVRGLTAWVVLENAPDFRCPQSEGQRWAISPPDWKRSPAMGLGILRITLKAPAEIAARGNGPDLEVEIAAQRRAAAGRHRLCPQPERSQARFALDLAAGRRPCFPAAGSVGRRFADHHSRPGRPRRAGHAQLRRLCRACPPPAAW